MDNKTYLGDSVYAEFDRGIIRLYLSNGLQEKNEIILEPEVFNALVTFVNRQKEIQFHNDKD